MKKKKIELSKKLVISKDIVTGLSSEQQQNIKGGATEGICYTAGTTCPWTMCAGCTQTRIVNTSCPPYGCITIGC